MTDSRQVHVRTMLDSLRCVMEKLGIREALAVDSDFTPRFIARPGSEAYLRSD
jgi:hypothetical protein